MASDIARRLAGAAIHACLTVGLVACGPSAGPGSTPPPSSAPGTASPGLASTGASPEATASPAPAATPASSPSTAPTATSAGPFTLTSDAFAEGGAIPPRYTCDGANISPLLRWTGPPAGTVTFALIVDDPDAGGFIHWVVYDIEPTASALAEDVPLQAGGGPPQGRNSFGKTGYGGPCPPSGTHHYRFRLLAVAIRPALNGTPSAAEVSAATARSILGEALLTGTYRRH